MGDIFKDSRFNKLINDPKYRQIPKTERKVKIDKRFQSMFDSDKFKVKYTVDKRGRPVNQSSSENLKKYYDLSSEEEEDTEDEEDDNDEDVTKKDDNDSEKELEEESVGKFVKKNDDSEDENEASEKEDDIKNDELIKGDLPKAIRKKLRDLSTDYARGEGVLLSDSSSDEETEEEEGEELEHHWGELDADAETCEDATHRLALCNMDWDNIKASDLFVLFNSFLPPGGLIKNVTIYPSEFGLKRMKEEDLRGPIELTEVKLGENSDDSEGEEGSKYHMEKLRQYQLNRLKYYYAVAVFDSPATANKIYTDCDGIEYESSAAKLDLRFIPDDVTFDQEAHDECSEAPDSSRYKPRLFTTTALQQAKVELTWDAVNPHRKEVLKNAADGDIDNEDLKNYLACSSEEESEEENGEKENDKEEKREEVSDEKLDPISKYKNLLLEIESSENKKKNQDMEMEISWGLGLKQKTEELVKKKMSQGDKLTPFEEMVEKKKEKRKAKKLERKNKAKNGKENEESDSEELSDVPSDIDMNDPYFAEEFKNEDFVKKKTKKKSKKVEHSDSDNEEENRKRAELELLLGDDDDLGKSHFSLKKIQESENISKSKNKRKMKKGQTDVLPDFTVDVNDDRFSALYTSHNFNIDPTDPNYKKTQAMEKLIQEKLKRRTGEEINIELPTKKTKGDPALNVLVNSLKRKTGHLSKK